MPIRAINLHDKLREGLGAEWFFAPQNFMPMPLIAAQDPGNTVGWVLSGPRVQPAPLGDTPGIGASLHLIRGMPDAPIGAAAGAPGHDSMAILVHGLTLPKTWFFQGTKPSDFFNIGGDVTMPGARRLGFMVADAVGVTPTLLIDIHGRTNFGRDIIETLTLTGLTNTKQTGWVSWANNYTNNLGAAGVTGAYYNPNSGTAYLGPSSGVLPNSLILGTGGKFAFIITNITAANPAEVTVNTTHNHLAGDHVLISNVTGTMGVGPVVNTSFTLPHLITPTADNKFTLNGVNTVGLTYGGGGFAYFPSQMNWARLPLMPQFQTRNAWSRVYKIVIRERAGTTADTLLIPCWNTVSFGLRTRIDSVDDIEEGGVTIHPWSAPFAGIAGLPTEIVVVTTCLVPLWGELSKRVITFEPEFNVVSFTNTLPVASGRLGTLNPHVTSFATTEFQANGELIPGFFDWAWELMLRVNPGPLFG